MLGEKISEEHGKISRMRMLPGDDYRYLKNEVSFQTSSKIFGVDYTDMGTYQVFERVPSQLFGEGQGIIFTSEGESAIWRAHGVGHMTGKGMAMSFRFSCAFQAGPTGKLARLNKVLVIGEHEVDAEGNAHSILWEWK